ncbi:glutathione-regulated potassium-efflux system ancillary protein KefG [Paenibacillus sophorae]|uniref:Glutathione-regulated potassium-efflux system ancillary protein KefG n=1 Tax=Paenibacillus sophorae TaxID=1333845 RepID=A0A1H8J012_9BACL|nr:NAD(P)H-dependent oxidoreductase [Paenibacillus sophorae]QWU16155.1 NAD(P)H-dependent oxidoreductase [Paenibacillus sophorae]SEN74082.1 glutathione-regulated potassium-efflux system ancillary protein KefG [Paenibacillus sophorae]
MKTLVIVAHPNLTNSVVNKAWVERLSQEKEITVHDLYAEYPERRINVEREQQLLLEHDRIVFQFPLYWYSSPSLLKEWQDVVLTYGWAYGAEGTKLHGKEFVLAISTGGPEAAYQAGGFNHYSMSELTKPFQATANLTGMRFLPTFTMQGVRLLTNEQICESAEALVRHLKASL